MAGDNENEVVWFFSFGLEAGQGKRMPRRFAEDLLDHIIVWAEERGLEVGGGYTAGSVLDRQQEKNEGE